MSISGNVDIFQRNRKWFFSRHVQFDSGFHVMATNEISRNRSKIILASASSSVESSWCGVGEEGPSDSPWRTSCSSPRSERSRNKDDVLRRWSPPEILTIPSATGDKKLSPLIGVNTSFVLSLRAWSSDPSICSNSSLIADNMSPF